MLADINGPHTGLPKRVGPFFLYLLIVRLCVDHKLTTYKMYGNDARPAFDLKIKIKIKSGLRAFLLSQSWL